MANSPSIGWQPEWAVAPGEVLLETLQERGMTQAELAQRMARPAKTINEIIKGKAAITPETAIQLERTLGISARFWIGMEVAYREALARSHAREELELSAAWADKFPVRELVQRHLISRRKSKAEVVEELLSFFQVSSPDAFERHWATSTAAFRASPAFAASQAAVAAWLRWGEIEAARLEVDPYDAHRFRLLLPEIRPLTRRSPFMQVVNRLRKTCLEAGVIVLMIPELKGTHLSGATHRAERNPIIQLSLRHKSDDHFWFTFFHEAAHVLHSSRGQRFVDGEDFADAGSDSPDEQAANEFARNTLLPLAEYEAFVQRDDFSEVAVRSFAEEQKVSPGIVVGRLQRDDHLPSHHLNNLKKPIQWAQE